MQRRHTGHLEVPVPETLLPRFGTRQDFRTTAVSTFIAQGTSCCTELEAFCNASSSFRA
jgi:hypothetical protein